MTAPLNHTAENRRRRRRWAKCVIAWLVAAIYLFPVYWMVNTSLKSGKDMFATPPQLFPHSVYTGSYQAVFSDKYGTAQAFVNSVIIASTVLIKQHSILDVVAAVVVAYLIRYLVYTVDWKRLRDRGQAFAE